MKTYLLAAILSLGMASAGCLVRGPGHGRSHHRSSKKCKSGKVMVKHKGKWKCKKRKHKNKHKHRDHRD